MMNSLSISFLVILALLAAIQAVLAVIFIRLFYKALDPISDTELPMVSILLSLRGADPHLAVGLRRLIDQNYPRYDIRIVVDQQNDPAWHVVQQAMSEAKTHRTFVSVLHKPLETCSLKCSALVQLARDLPEDTEVVVLADADLVSHADWLRELVSPLSDPKVGATHGNRWFWPAEARWGSLVRYLWNVAAVVPMYFCHIPWGGTFAIRARILRESGLLDKWSRAVVEDAPVRTALEDHGLSVRFVPMLMMVNREECGLPFSLDFIKRQLTWTKIYHPRWAAVVLHAFSTSFMFLGAIAAIPVMLLTGNSVAAAITVAGVLSYLLAMMGLIGLLEAGVRHVIRRRGELPLKFGWPMVLRLPIAIPLTQLIHFLAVLLAMFRRHVAWRGVVYEVRGPWNIRMLNYKPFEQPEYDLPNTSL